MGLIRRGLRALVIRPLHWLWRVVTWIPRTLWRWWAGLEPAERVLYRAAGLLAIGFGMLAVPLGLIVPGALFAAVFFGFSLRRP